MNLKLKHIALFIASILFAGCAMETKKATSESYDIIATEEVETLEEYGSDKLTFYKFEEGKYYMIF